MKYLRQLLILGTAAAATFVAMPAANAGNDGCTLYICASGGGNVIIHAKSPGSSGGGGQASSSVSSGGSSSSSGSTGYVSSGGSSSSGGSYSGSYSGGGGVVIPEGGGCWTGESSCVTIGRLFNPVNIPTTPQAPGAAPAAPAAAVAPIAGAAPVVVLPSPAELAQEALTLMDLQPIAIGSAPGAGKLGFVGLPVWLWAENPSANTYGPITRSASAGPITVTATARVQSIDWSMGDGNGVTCTTPGTPYADHWGIKDSPDCGYRYEQTSADQPGNSYTVTATSHWVVNWAGAGQSGIIQVDQVADSQFSIGEIQVLNQ